MESVALFAITHQLGIKAAVVNVVVNTILTDNMVGFMDLNFVNDRNSERAGEPIAKPKIVRKNRL